MSESVGGPVYAASVWPWSRCAVCGYRKWCHALMSDGPFYVHDGRSDDLLAKPPTRVGKSFVSWFMFRVAERFPGRDIRLPFGHSTWKVTETTTDDARQDA